MITGKRTRDFVLAKKMLALHLTESKDVGIIINITGA